MHIHVHGHAVGLRQNVEGKRDMKDTDMLYAYTKTGRYMFNKLDIIEKTKKDHMYIVHGHKARVSEREGGSMREKEGEYERKREREGGEGARESLR